MRFTLKVKPGAKQDKVEELADGSYKVWVKAPPAEGRANEAVICLMADHLNVPKSHLSLVRGASSKDKVLECS